MDIVSGWLVQNKETPLKNTFSQVLPRSLLASLSLQLTPFFLFFAEARATGMEPLGLQESALCVQWPFWAGPHG